MSAAANARAMPKPMPDTPPVTSAVLPLKSILCPSPREITFVSFGSKSTPEVLHARPRSTARSAGTSCRGARGRQRHPPAALGVWLLLRLQSGGGHRRVVRRGRCRRLPFRRVPRACGRAPSLRHLVPELLHAGGGRTGRRLPARSFSDAGHHHRGAGPAQRQRPLPRTAPGWLPRDAPVQAGGLALAILRSGPLRERLCPRARRLEDQASRLHDAVAGGIREGLVADSRAPAACHADLSSKSNGSGRAAVARRGAPHLAAPAGRAHALRAPALRRTRQAKLNPRAG